MGRVERRRSSGIETRTATLSTDIGCLQEQHEWPGLAAIGKVRRICETAAGTTAGTACRLLGTARCPDRLNEATRRRTGSNERAAHRNGLPACRQFPSVNGPVNRPAFALVMRMQLNSCFSVAAPVLPVLMNASASSTAFAAKVATGCSTV